MKLIFNIFLIKLEGKLSLFELNDKCSTPMDQHFIKTLEFLQKEKFRTTLARKCEYNYSTVN